MPARSAQELITTPSKAQPQPGVKVTRYRRTTRKTPQCPFCDLRKLRKGTVSSRKGGSKKKCGLKAASPAGSLHSTFPINLRETKQVPSPYHTPQKRSIPIQRTPGTAGTQYWTPSVQIAGPAIPPAARTARPVISPGISVQTAKLGPSPGISKQSAKPGQSPGTSTRTARPVKATERWASWSRQRSTSSSSGLQQTPTAPTGRTHALAGPKQPQISTTTSSKDKRSISQTSAGSSPGDTSALKSTGATKTVENATKQAGTYIPERDYNPVCNCTNCRKERKLREENDVCDCYDCITEMRSTISAGKSSQKSSASPHRPIRMKAEYTWVKKLLKIQQPAGRYHTPNEKRVEYPWQKDSKKSASLAHSHQSGGATSRDRSSSSHHGISTPSVSQQSQPSSATTGDSHTASQTEPSKQQEDAQSGFKTANKSTSSAAGTSQTPSPYITPRSTRKSSRSTRKSSRSSRKSRRARRGRHAGQPRWPSSSDESESWSEPEQESGSGSYRTPRSRSRSQRKSKKRKPWR
ncbi:hypothetical protein ANCCAN_06909 [Ancylostoma caninum]|uniref:Uncharacterized protein n=1 Tax=Ancylostoma caninum TaxID=29170 RepID=A0A368GU07_ANCCA|nr:hypothetical protein ANCCAN_06909 [Ancylostoma caninum]